METVVDLSNADLHFHVPTCPQNYYDCKEVVKKKNPMSLQPSLVMIIHNPHLVHINECPLAYIYVFIYDLLGLS